MTNKLKTCANWGRGCRENKSITETRCLRSEENGTNKQPRGITRRREVREKLKQSNEQIRRNEINTCKGAGFCWGLSTLAGAAGGWRRALVAGSAAWIGTWASAITRFFARRILTRTGLKWYVELLLILGLQGTGTNSSFICNIDDILNVYKFCRTLQHFGSHSRGSLLWKIDAKRPIDNCTC